MTDDRSYTERLEARGSSWWKRVFDVQAPYRWNINRLDLGYVLDVGCGIGRNLGHLHGNGVGVDSNPTSVAVARAAGLVAYVVPEWPDAPEAVPMGFDSLLFAHVLEHMPRIDARLLVATYLPYLTEGGKVVVIVPQERGFASDDTHVEFLEASDVETMLGDIGLGVDRVSSFPFPKWAGRWFTYNETIVVARLPARR